MKKIIFSIAGLFVFVNMVAQQSTLIVNNYSSYDFHTALSANPYNSCLPSVEIGYVGNLTNPSQVIVPANSNDMNGLQLIYKNFHDASLLVNPSQLYPISTYWVTTSATTSGPRASNHPSLNPAGGIANNVDWRHAKFSMFYAGTNTPVSSTNPTTYFLGNLGDGTNSCNIGDSYISTNFGDAEWFTITSAGIKYSYIQIY